MQPSKPPNPTATAFPAGVRARRHILFPSLVLQYEFGDSASNDWLYGAVKRLQADAGIKNAGDVRSLATVGGYQPDVDLREALAGEAQWEQFNKQIVHPAVQGYLADHCRLAGWPAAGAAYTFNANWAVLYPSGAYQAPHLHPNVFCVLAYYARVPERPEPEGAISFINPHLESTFPRPGEWNYHQRYQPRNGTALLFPGWLQHYSQPHFGADDERLLLTFDVTLLPD